MVVADIKSLIYCIKLLWKYLLLCLIKLSYKQKKYKYLKRMFLKGILTIEPREESKLE